MLDNKTEKEQDLANNKSDMITEETSEKIENNLAIKERIMVELDKEDLLDFQFLFSTEVIWVALEVIDELLKEEKSRFDSIIDLEEGSVSFQDIVTESKLEVFYGLMSHINNVLNTEETQANISVCKPKLIEFGDYVGLNKKYYDILFYLRKNEKLTPDQTRVLDKEIENMEIQWVHLEWKEKARLEEINKELSELSENYKQNLLDEEKAFSAYFENNEFIKDLPEDILANAKKKAEKNEKSGWEFGADLGSTVAIMQYCSDEKTRKDLIDKHALFATEGDVDNRPIILKTIDLKHEKARLLWHKNHAELSLVKKMAETPEEVIALLKDVGEKAEIKFEAEIQEMKDYFDIDEINYYNLTFYTRKLKEEKYNLDDKVLKEYFQYDKAVAYMFNLANKLFGIELKELDTPTYHPDAKVYEVYRNWKLISHYILDPFYRESKRSGAWANTLRPKVADNNTRVPVTVNVSSVLKSTDGPTLLTFNSMKTLFHEFGHGLHFMLYEGNYEELSSMRLEWDAVELPSQLMENWLWEEEVLLEIGEHYKTGKKIPMELIERKKQLDNFNVGFVEVRQTQLAMMDMELYTNDAPSTVEELDQKIIDINNSLGFIPRDVETYKMHAQFAHIFAGWYSAGYYSYLRSRLLDADVYGVFKKEWIFNPETGKRFVDTLMGQGIRKKARDMFIDFMWRDVDPEVYYRKKEFIK